MGRRIVSGGCHPAEQKNDDFAALRRLSPDDGERDLWRWGACQGASSSGPRSKRRLFIASGMLSRGGDFLFSRVYDHSLPHSRLATAARAPARGYSPPDCASDPLAGPAGRRVPHFCNIFIFISCSSFISKVRL
ncbi:unnamed protein product [Spirodela intermedia]|uniref:Uncharacterized protein n=1 Tax=Spirodela intermedia TaxID=51605 RepID=A0A7I8K8X1_SPIIN|nr:unnamed protein product [Spirodela intermedia]